MTRPGADPSQPSSDALWADAFERLLARPAKEPPGEGWKTFDEIRKGCRRGRGQLQRQIKKEVKAGRMEMFSGSRHNGLRVTRQVWYRPTS